jgi:hypothetical protein
MSYYTLASLAQREGRGPHTWPRIVENSWGGMVVGEAAGQGRGPLTPASQLFC